MEKMAAVKDVVDAVLYRHGRVLFCARRNAILCSTASEAPIVRKASNRASAMSWTLQFSKVEHSRSE
jgi:hypothetical protein